MARRSIDSVDTIWLNMDRADNLMVVESLMVLDGPLDLTRFREVMQHRVVDVYPVFHQRPVPSRLPLRAPHWEDDPEFTLERHLHVVELTRPGGEAELRAYVDDHLGRPLPRDRPLWQVHVLTGYGEQTAVYSRLHHALADGIALTQVLLSLSDETADAPIAATGTTEAPEPTGAGNPVTAALGLAQRAASGLLRAPAMLGPARWGRVLSVTRQTAAAGAKLLLTQNPATPVTGAPQVRKRAVWAKPIPLPPVVDAAHRTGSTLNDVLVAALAGALGAYLRTHDGVPTDIPTMVPVNMRPPGEALPRALGNRFTLVLLILPSSLATPFERLAETKRRMQAIKGSPEAALTYGMIRGMGRTGPDLERVLADFFAARASGVTTNVPGPRSSRYLCGTRISSMLGWAPESGHQTLGTAIFTYDGSINVGFKVDVDVVEHPEELVSAFCDEVEALCSLGRAAKPSRQARRRTAAQPRATQATVTAQRASPSA